MKKRILVVEDDWSFASAVRDLLDLLGYEVVGPYRTLDEAFVVARQERLNGALLDINVGAKTVYPLAEYLTQSGLPLLLMSGLGDVLSPKIGMKWRCLSKAALVGKLDAELDVMLADGRQPG